MYTAPLGGLCPRRPGADFTRQEHQKDVAGPGWRGGGLQGLPLLHTDLYPSHPIPSHPAGPFVQVCV